MFINIKSIYFNISFDFVQQIINRATEIRIRIGVRLQEVIWR